MGSVDTTNGYEINYNYIESVIIMGAYFGGFAFGNYGITIGKMMMKLEVLKTDLTKLDRNKLIAREIIKAILWPLVVPSLIICTVRKDNKSIHDILIDSIVLKPIVENKKYYDPNDFKNEDKSEENQNNSDDYYM